MEIKVEDTQPLPLDNLNSYSHVKEKKRTTKPLHVVFKKKLFIFLHNRRKQNHRRKSDEHSFSKENYSP